MPLFKVVVYETTLLGTVVEIEADNADAAKLQAENDFKASGNFPADGEVESITYEATKATLITKTK